MRFCPLDRPSSRGWLVCELDEQLLSVPGVHARDVLGGEAREHSTRTELDDGLHLHGPHRDHGPRPVDLAQHLLAKLVTQRGHRAHRLPRRVREDRDRRRRELEPVDHLAECGRGAGHQRRVRGQGDGEDERATCAGRESKALGLFDGDRLAGEDELDVRVAVGDPEPALRRGLLADRFHLRFVEADDRDHAAGLLVGGLGHDAAALLDQEQSRLPGNRARGSKRCDLAEAVAGGDAHVLEAVALAPHLVGRPAHRHHTWLDDLGAVQLLERAFEAEPAHGHLQDLFRPFENPASGRVAVVQVATHARFLHSLAGEQQRDRAVEADHPVYIQVIKHAPQVSPEPKPASRTWSPLLTRPFRIASSSASGIEALEVLPYSSMLIATRSSGSPMRRAAASMMRKFAWCGTHRSISSSATPAVLQTSFAWRMKMSTANLKTSGPTMSMNGVASLAAYAPFSMLPHVTCAKPRP